MRIVVSGGGTGGHIYPALATCEGLKRKLPDCDLLYIGSDAGMEMEIVPRAGVPFQGVPARKLRKLLSPATAGVALSLFKGFREARRYIRAFQADAVVGTGGYVAAAAALAGVSLKMPTVILAPDSIPGRTNRMLARFAQRICVVFDETVSRFPAGKTVVTGLPLRAGVVAPPDIDKRVARSRFAPLQPDWFTVLVIGGSQGARAVNDRIVAALPALLAAGIQVLHQAGPNNIAAVTAAVENLGLVPDAPYFAAGFLDDTQMPLAYRAADLIVCRGGISTLSEATANALPAVVVPLPTAYADHQTANAKALERAGAALCRPESALTAERLAEELAGLKAAPDRLDAMTQASRKMSRPNAADSVAEIVLSL